MKKIDGRYRVHRELGSGMSGDVLLVEDPNGGRMALKYLKEWQPGVSEAEAHRSFKREFSILKDLNHPNIARILDFGRDEKGRYYFTSEFVEGEDFFRAARKKSPEGIEGLVVQALRALEYLHSRRIYHLDLKPGNMLVTSDGRVKLIDFGLAGEKFGEKIGGTPAYMAPEVLYGEPPDGRADLYSLGVVFYYCLTGTNPLKGATVPETLDRQKKLVPPPVSKINPDLPSYLDRVVSRLLEKKRGERFTSASHVIRDINLLSGRKYPVETSETLLSYLPEEGAFIGRVRETASAQELCLQLKNRTGRFALRLVGAKGTGKTRFLKELKYFCQLNDLKVLFILPGDPPPRKAEASVLLLDDVDRWGESDEEAWFEFLQKAGKTSFVSLLTSSAERAHPISLLQPLLAPSGIETIDLRNFPTDELRQYLVSLTGLEHPPAGLIDALWERTDGNPLFVSEILKTLIAGGLLFDSQGRWRQTTMQDIGIDLSEAAIPENLKELLEKQYIEEPGGARQLVCLLTLVGRPLRAEDLPVLMRGDYREEDLTRLVREGRVLREAKGDRISLKNPLWAEVAEGLMSPGEKQQWHDRIALWLESSRKDPAIAKELARHWGEGSDPKKAVGALIPLARSMLEAGRGREAAPLFQKALERLPADAFRDRIETLMGLGEACCQSDAFSESLESFRRIRPFLKQIENRDEDILYKADIHERLASVALKLRQTEEAKADIQAGLALLNDYQDDPIRRMILENDLAQVRCQEGGLDAAEEIFSRTDREWRALTEKDRERVTNNDLGFLYLLKGDAAKAAGVLEEQLKFLSRLPRRYPEARCHYNLAEASFVLGNYERTAEHYGRCLDLAREVKAHDLLLRAYNGLGNVTAYHAEKQDVALGIEYYLRALAIAQKLEDLSSQAAIHSNLGILYQESGQVEEAEHHLLGAIRIVRSMKERSAYDLSYLARAHLEMGSLLRGRRDFEASRDHLRDAQSFVEEQESLKGLRFWVRYEFACLYRDQGREESFRSALKDLREAASGPDEMRKLQKLEEESPTRGPAIASSAISEGMSQFETRSLRQPPPAWKGLLKILRFLNSERDLNYLLKTILHYALELSDAETALLVLAKEDGSLEVRSALSSAVDADLQAFSTAIARKVLDEGRVIATADAQGDARFSEERSVYLLKLRRVVGLPIQTPGRTLGVLYLDTRGGVRGGDLHQTETVEILQAFADQAGLALENARLFRESEEGRHVVEARLGQAEESLSLAQSLLKEQSVLFETRYSYANIVTRSRSMRDLFKTLDRVTGTNLAILIQGETGTGKELVAKALHYNGSRKAAPFVAVNCGAIPSELMESELFGHKAGAFTGATVDKIGLCEAADGGTLFLDEVAELSPALQAKLLRFLQEKEFRRLGETEARHADVRILSATHQDLSARIRDGRFREDLYFRLAEMPILIPPLRDRREDIPLLVERFLEECREEMKQEKKFRIDRELLRRMIDYPWPGNVRELEGLVRVVCALAENGVLTTASLPAHSPLAGRGRRGEASSSVTSSVLIDEVNRYRPDWRWEDYERHLIAQAYRHHHYRAIPTAQAIGLTPPTVYQRIRKWNLEDPENPLYKEEFRFVPGTTLRGCQRRVFEAALRHHKRPYAALRALGISQGHFYKVIK